MTQNWYFRNLEKTSGPFSIVEINNLAAAGLVHPEDLVWIEDDKSSEATVARGALNFFSLTPKPVSAPDWLSDVAAEEKIGPIPGPLAGDQPPDWLEDLRLWYGLQVYAAAKAATASAPPALQTGGTADWLEGWSVPDKSFVRKTELRPESRQKTLIPRSQPDKNFDATALEPEAGPESNPNPLAQPVSRAKTRVDPVVAQAIAETGFDPQTGRILDAVKFRKWQKAAHSKKTGVTNESLFEVFRKARTAIENWVDEDSRRPLILSGDMETIKKDAQLAAIFGKSQGFGSAMHDKLTQHLEFMVENRRKYYAACR